MWRRFARRQPHPDDEGPPEAVAAIRQAAAGFHAGQPDVVAAGLAAGGLTHCAVVLTMLDVVEHRVQAPGALEAYGLAVAAVARGDHAGAHQLLHQLDTVDTAAVVALSLAAGCHYVR
jgi:hypothetical protein